MEMLLQDGSHELLGTPSLRSAHLTSVAGHFVFSSAPRLLYASKEEAALFASSAFCLTWDSRYIGEAGGWVFLVLSAQHLPRVAFQTLCKESELSLT